MERDGATKGKGVGKPGRRCRGEQLVDERDGNAVLLRARCRNQRARAAVGGQRRADARGVEEIGGRGVAMRRHRHEMLELLHRMAGSGNQVVEIGAGAVRRLVDRAGEDARRNACGGDPLPREQDRKRNDDHRGLADDAGGIGPEGFRPTDTYGDFIDMQRAVQRQPQAADDRCAPAQHRIARCIDEDQPRPQIGEADVADEVRIGRSGGHHRRDEHIPVERLDQHEGAIGDRRDPRDDQQQLYDPVECVELSEKHGYPLPR